MLGNAGVEVQRLFQTDARGNGLVYQRVERRGARDLEHLVAFSLVGSDVAGLKPFEIEEHVTFGGPDESRPT